MPPEHVEMHVRHISPNASIIDIQGDLSAVAEPLLMQTYTEASTPKIRAIILNFTDLAYMNSSGIGLLVTLLIRAKRQKQQVMAYGLSEHYRHIFALTRISDMIKIHTTEAETIAAAERL
jgi:anti-sigma B factor antagonist